MSEFVYFITSDKIGSQDPELGARLMNTFFLKLIQADSLPSHILLMERSVQLLLPESPCLDAIKALEGRSVEVLACKTCLDYYDIKEKIGAGKVSNMPDIIEVMQGAEKVIHL
ncbi:MAG: DsrE family protein [Deltaproteobacteria bacterium]|nr:DsrE family protein [Deltaproteobacteria bacterium]